MYTTNAFSTKYYPIHLKKSKIDDAYNASSNFKSISNGLPFALAILGYLTKTINLFLQWFAKTLAKL
jgi:hypothetical protein